MKTQFLGPSYTLRSLPLSAQTAVNLYLEVNESQDGDTGAFYGTPGLTPQITFPLSGEGRALQLSGNEQFLYAVVGSAVYQIDKQWRIKQVGTLGTSQGSISTVANPTQVAFADALGWNYYDGSTFGQVSGAPLGSDVTYMDGVVIFTTTGLEFGITALNDLTSIDPIDVAEAEALPDDLVAVHADAREVWLLGTQTTEIWADTGAQTFPYERVPGGVIMTGCSARHSVAYVDGSVFWLSRDRTGKSVVVRTVGYQVEPVSTYALSYAIDNYDRIDDARAFCYEEEKHAFYVLIFPSADATWSYDVTTKLWSQRAWRDPMGVLHRHRANAHAFFNNYNVVQDWQTGVVYIMDMNSTTDAGAMIYRERAWPLLPQQEMRRMRLDKMELVMEAGTGDPQAPNLWMQMSYDGGVSFGNRVYQNAGPIGGRYYRARWRRGGTGRRPVARLATTSSKKVVWIAANVDGEVLEQ